MVTNSPTSPAPEPEVFTAWAERASNLQRNRSAVDWELADWLRDGKAKHGSTFDVKALSLKLGLSAKLLREAIKAATLFPAAQRNLALTFEHHLAVLCLPDDHAGLALAEAHEKGWDHRETRIAAIRRKADIIPPYAADVDWTDIQYQDIVRRWNRADHDARQMLIDQYEETGLAAIEL